MVMANDLHIRRFVMAMCVLNAGFKAAKCAVMKASEASSSN